MLEDLQIFAGVVNMMVGAGVIVYAYHMKKFDSYPYLKPIADYTLLFNLLFFSFLIMVYFSVKPPDYLSDRYRPVLVNGGYLVITLLEAGLIRSLWGVIRGFQNKTVSSRWRAGFIWGISLLVASYALRLLLMLQDRSLPWLSWIHSLLFNNLIVLEIPLLFLLLLKTKEMTDPGARRVGRSFGILYLSRYALAVLIIPYNIFIGIPQPFRLLTGFGAMLVFNLFPLVWYRTVFIRYAECIGRQFEGTGALERIFARYSISRREQEIMRLLIEGKSNREIADTLFIALPTVKNHVHNIYQKLKVSSRYGLIHRVMPFRKEGT